MRKVLGLILSIAIVCPLLLSGLALISISTWILNRDFYVDLLDNKTAYDVLFSEEMTLGLAEQIFPQAQGINTAALNAILQSLITPEFQSQQVRALINTAFDFIEGKSDTFSFQIDTQPLKQAFSGPQAQEYITQIAQILPVCGEGQEVRVGEMGIIVCKPDFISMENFVDHYLTPAMPRMLSFLPDGIPLGETFTRDDTLRDTVLLTSTSYYTAIGIIVALALFFWIAVALIAGTDWRERLKWLGWTLLIPAVVIFILSITGRSGISSVWIRYAINEVFLRNLPLPSAVRTGMLELSQMTITHISNVFLMVSGIAGALAIGFIAWGAATHPRTAAVTQPSETNKEDEQ